MKKVLEYFVKAIIGLLVEATVLGVIGAIILLLINSAMLLKSIGYYVCFGIMSVLILITAWEIGCLCVDSFSKEEEVDRYDSAKKYMNRLAELEYRDYVASTGRSGNKIYTLNEIMLITPQGSAVEVGKVQVHTTVTFFKSYSYGAIATMDYVIYDLAKIEPKVYSRDIMIDKVECVESKRVEFIDDFTRNKREVLNEYRDEVVNNRYKTLVHDGFEIK
ncbi:MAG: hypothetical protein ACRC6E_14835 [Fusobacteriaceae bacterium]